MNTGISAINEEVQRASAFVQPLFSEINKVIIGQKYLLDRLCIELLANGHVLSSSYQAEAAMAFAARSRGCGCTDGAGREVSTTQTV